MADTLAGDLDTWREVLACLADSHPPAVAAAACTCTVLRGLCAEERVWRRCCALWWRRTSSGSSDPPDGWPLACLGLTSHRAAHLALQGLGLDVMGLWACTTRQPGGQLVRLRCDGAKVRRNHSHCDSSFCSPTHPGGGGGERERGNVGTWRPLERAAIAI